MSSVMFNEFDPAKLNFQPCRNQRNGRMILMSYGASKGPIRIETPPMYVPFGLSTSDHDSGPSSRLEVRIDEMDDKVKDVLGELGFDDIKDLTMKDYRKIEDPTMQRRVGSVRLLHGLQALDAAVFNYCAQNDVECFGKKIDMPVDLLRSMFFKPSVKPGREKKDGQGHWPPLMHLKVSDYNDKLPKVKTTVDVARKLNKLPGDLPKDIKDDVVIELPWESVCDNLKGTTCIFIMQLAPVWFVNNNFGISFRLHTMQILDAPTKINQHEIQGASCWQSGGKESRAAASGTKAAGLLPDDFEDDFE